MLALKAAFHDEDQALRFVEQTRWPDRVCCPTCGVAGRVGRLGGASTTRGSFKCYGCRRRFTVRTGTVLEGSHVPLTRWLRVAFLLACSTRQLGCKHIEEATSVAPRIARSMRRKLLDMLNEPSLGRTCFPPATEVDWGRELATEGAIAFADLCKAVGIGGDEQGEDFLAAVRVLVGPSSSSRQSPLASVDGAWVTRAAALSRLELRDG